MVTFIAVWGLVAIAAAIAAAILAGIKRRDHSFWAAWSFIFPPLVILLLIMPKNAGIRPRRATLEEESDKELAQ